MEGLKRGVMIKMNENKDEFKWVLRSYKIIRKIYNFISNYINKINEKMKDKYSARTIGLWSSVIALFLIVYMLFVYPYLGISDDGSFSRNMRHFGIDHIGENREDNYFNYYNRRYMVSPEKAFIGEKGISSVNIFIKIALNLDKIFTKDSFFDMRFMGLVYTILFIPAFFIIVTHAAKRVNNFTEGVIIGILGIIIFSDISYTTYFCSFYSEPLVFICFLLCICSALSFNNKDSDILWLILYTISGVILITSEKQYSVLGIFLGILSVRFIFMERKVLYKALCVFVSMILFFSFLWSSSNLESNFTLSSKYNAMTRGILLQSKNPEETLKEFGIDSNYSVLADTNTNDFYPLTTGANESLNNGFFDKYNSIDIIKYYIKHPISMVYMLNIASKEAFNTRISYSGNYEKEAGFNPKAKSLFWSSWSTFKMQSAPKTIGVVIVLYVLTIILWGNKSRRLFLIDKKGNNMTLEIMMLVIFSGLYQAIQAIVMSGDSELNKHIFIFSLSIDLLIYFCFSGIFHKLNIIQNGGE